MNFTSERKEKMMRRLKSLAVVYGAIFSILIGFGAGAFLTVTSELIKFFWPLLFGSSFSLKLAFFASVSSLLLGAGRASY